MIIKGLIAGSLIHDRHLVCDKKYESGFSKYILKSMVMPHFSLNSLPFAPSSSYRDCNIRSKLGSPIE